MTLVFVYGTLKQNFPNFHINTATRIEGDFFTKQPYPLYLEGERYVPWLVLDKNKGHQVKGELYRANQQTLNNMDILESVGEPSGYQKIQLPIVSSCGAVVEGRQEVLAFVYVKSLQQRQYANIKLGPLKEYTVEQASLYRPRC